MKLLVSQKDSLYDLVEKNGLSPTQFEFIETASTMTNGQIATKLKLKGSEFFFSFETVSGNKPHYSIYSPGEFSYDATSYPGFWFEQFNVVSNWLIYLKREINTPNKWERLYKEMSEIYFKSDNNDTKFSVLEFEDIKAKIISLKTGIKLIGFSSEEISVFDNKLNYLIEQAKEMNKFDWKSLFIGTIISIIIQLTVNTANAKELWDLIKKVFSNYLLP
jgi:hypothetical protein